MCPRERPRLDDDVAERLAREAQRTGQTYRAVVNSALRRGLEPPPATEPFRIRATPMGPRPGIDLDDIEGLLDRMDGPFGDERGRRQHPALRP